MGGWTKGGPYTGNKYFSPFKNPELHPDSPEGEHLPNRLADETAKFIRQNKQNPFLAYLSFYSVHTPLQGRKDLVEKYKKRAAKISGDQFGPLHDRKVRILQKHAVYAAMVEAMDEAMGKVLAALDKQVLPKIPWSSLHRIMVGFPHPREARPATSLFAVGKVGCMRVVSGNHGLSDTPV